jgi:hypothetical protein
MDPDLKTFVLSFARVVVPNLWPVMLTAFVSMPLVLGHHPGESQGPIAGSAGRHMT